MTTLCLIDVADLIPPTRRAEPEKPKADPLARVCNEAVAYLSSKAMGMKPADAAKLVAMVRRDVPEANSVETIIMAALSRR